MCQILAYVMKLDKFVVKIFTFKNWLLFFACFFPQDWKIPPCISNWKNQKGYTIPLDKRLAADGRGLQQVIIFHLLNSPANGKSQFGVHLSRKDL